MTGDEDYLVWRHRHRIHLYRFLILYSEDAYTWIKKKCPALFHSSWCWPPQNYVMQHRKSPAFRSDLVYEHPGDTCSTFICLKKTNAVKLWLGACLTWSTTPCTWILCTINNSSQQKVSWCSCPWSSSL